MSLFGNHLAARIRQDEEKKEDENMKQRIPGSIRKRMKDYKDKLNTPGKPKTPSAIPMAVTMSEDEKDAANKQTKNSFWNTYFSGGVEWEATDMIEEHSMALLNTSLLSNDSGSSPAKSAQKEQVFRPSINSLGKSPVEYDSDEENSTSLQFSESSLQPDDRTPVKVKAFTTFRQNSANIALDESNAYLLRIDQLERELELAKKQAREGSMDHESTGDRLGSSGQSKILQSEIEKLNELLTEAHNESSKLKRELSDTNEKLAVAATEIGQLQGETITPARFQSLSEECELLRQEVRLLRTKESKTVERCLSLQTRLREVEWKSDLTVEQEQAILERDEQISNLVQAREALTKQLQIEKKTHEGEIMKRDIEIKELSNALTSLRDDKERESAKLAEDLAKRDAEVRAARNTADELRATLRHNEESVVQQVSERDARIEEAHDLIEELRDQERRLKEEFSTGIEEREIESTQAIEALNRNLELTRSEHEDMAKLLSAREEEIEQLEKDSSTAQRRLEQRIEELIEELSDERQQSSQQAVNLRQDIADLEDELESTRVGLENHIKILAEKLSESQSQLVLEEQKRRDMLNANAEEITMIEARAQEMIDKKANEVEALKSRWSDLESELLEKKNAIVKLNGKISEIEKDRDLVLVRSRELIEKAFVSFESQLVSRQHRLDSKVENLESGVIHVQTMLGRLHECIDFEANEKEAVDESADLQLMEEARASQGTAIAMKVAPQKGSTPTNEADPSSLQFSHKEDDTLSSIAGLSHLFDTDSANLSIDGATEQKLLNPWSEAEDLRERLAEIDDDRLNLRERLRESQRVNATLESELGRTRSALSEAENKTTTLTKALAEAEERFSSFEDDIFETNAASLKLREVHEAIRSERDALSRQLEEKNESIASLNDELRDTCIRLQEANGERDALALQLEEKNERMSSLNDELRDTCLRLQEANTELALITEQHGSALAEYRRLKNEMARASSTSDKESERLSEVLKELDEATQVRASLERECQTLSSKCNELKGLIADKDELLEFEFEKVSDLESKVEELTNAKHTIEAERNRLIHADDLNQRLKEEVDSKNHELRGMSTTLEEEQKRITSLENDIESLKAQLESTIQLCDNNKAGAEAAETLATDAETRLIEAREEMKRLQEAYDRSKEDADRYEMELNEALGMVKLLKQTQEDGQELQDLIEEQNKRINELQRYLRSNEEDREQLEFKLSDCMQSLQKKSSQVQSLEVKCRRLKDYVRQLSDKCDDWERFHREKLVSINQLKREHIKTKRQIAELATQYQSGEGITNDGRRYFDQDTTIEAMSARLEAELEGIAQELANATIPVHEE